MHNTISLCIIARNEAHQIIHCINSAKPFVGQVVVVDTGSTDNTPCIARSLGAEVYVTEWRDDFSQARNISLGHALGDWILFLDCDEELDQQTAQALVFAVEEKQFDGYWVDIVNYFNGKPSSALLGFRLFRNNPSYRFQCRIHEQILPSILQQSSADRIGYSNIIIKHYGYENLADVAASKSQRNLRILEMTMVESGDTGSVNFYLGVEHEKLGNYKQALGYYASALAKSTRDEPYLPPMIRSIALCMMSIGNYEEGVSLIDKYLGIYGDYTDLVFVKGILFCKMGNYDKCLSCMNRCVEMGKPPKKYFSMYGISTDMPRDVIRDVVDSLINMASTQLSEGAHDKAFIVLIGAFAQLQKTPCESLYLKLIRAMHGLVELAETGL